jgi:hypothetical protein
MASHGYNKTKQNSPVPRSALPLSSNQRQSTPVTDEHQPELKLPTGKPFPTGTLPKKFQWKNLFSTAARSRVVRFTRSRRQSMPVSNGHRLKPSNRHRQIFPFIRGHPKINPHGNHMGNSIFPPPLGHGSSDSPAVYAYLCISVSVTWSAKFRFSLLIYLLVHIDDS